jgi:hypothetical protein
MGTHSNLAAGYFNGDDKADIAVFDGESGNTGGVLILLGNGDGTFAAAKDFVDATGGGDGFAVGDFTGKGGNNTDVAVSSFGNDETVDHFLDILPSQGDGTLGSAIESDVGWFNTYVMNAAQLDGDGTLDLVVYSMGGGGQTAGYVLNSGGGKFTPISQGQLTIESPSLTGDYAIDDVTGDGIADAVYPDMTMGACVQLNNGQAQFAAAVCYAPVQGSQPDWAVVGDIDGKNGNDIVTIGGSFLGAYLNKGKGQFGAAVATATTSGSVSDAHLADMNNDGKADLVTYDGGTLSVYLSNGDGTFGMPAQYPLGAGVLITVGDFAGNGLRGVAAVDLNNNAISAIVATCKQ